VIVGLSRQFDSASDGCPSYASTDVRDNAIGPLLGGTSANSARTFGRSGDATRFDVSHSRVCDSARDCSYEGRSFSIETIGSLIEHLVTDVVIKGTLACFIIVSKCSLMAGITMRSSRP
jgi:hypothetical protein